MNALQHGAMVFGGIQRRLSRRREVFESQGPGTALSNRARLDTVEVLRNRRGPQGQAAISKA